MVAKTLHILYSGHGGTTNYVANWIKAAQIDHHSCDCLFYGIEMLNPHTENLFTDYCNNVFFIHKKGRIDFDGYIKIRKILKKEYNQIILHIDSLIIPVSYFKNLRTRLFFIEHQANQLKDKRRWYWSRLAQKKADIIISLTSDYQSELKKYLPQFNTSKNKIILTGIDIEHYASNKSRTTKLYGAVGRLNNQRDFESLVHAFNKLDDSYTLEIAGDGPDLEKLRGIANKNIFFLGELNDQEMVSFLNRISVFLKPSFGETSSPAIMEAQASGLPLIVWDVLGINSIINKTNGILVLPGNINQIRDALLSLNEEDKKSVDLMSDLKEASLRFAKKNLSHIKMYNTYKELML